VDGTSGKSLLRAIESQSGTFALLRRKLRENNNSQKLRSSTVFSQNYSTNFFIYLQNFSTTDYN
jgi:hypothetical protein